MVTSKAYDDMVQRNLREREARGNIVSTKLSESECAKEVAETAEGVFIEPIPTIEPTGPELDLIAHGLQTGEVIVPVVKRKRGRPKGSRNRPKNA